MNKSLIPDFEAKFEKFKQTNDYSQRVKQSAFCPLAKEIISETLKNESFEKDHLTGFIQMFRPYCSDKNFQKYLSINIHDNDIQDKILKSRSLIGQSGYTNPGKAAILNITLSHLNEVKKFLSGAYEIYTLEQAKMLVDNFLKLNIPEVKQGVFSPWLHYINPKIFPISNNTHNSFCKWMGIKRDYPTYIEDCAELMKIVDEPDLGNLDFFAYHFNQDSPSSEPPNLNPSTQTAIEMKEPTSLVDTKYSKNIILYGPAGTGKTYSSIDLAVNIATNTKNTNHKENKKKFDELREEGQIEFITFHQNYSYEDFMVGLRPDVENEQLRFKPYQGIFYEIAKRARDNYNAHIEHTSIGKTFDEALNELTHSIVVEGNEIPIKMTSGISYHIYDITNYSLYFKKPRGESNHTLSIQTLRDIVENKRVFSGGLSVYYIPLAEKMRNLMKPQEESKIEEFKNYVLIIDEINRANISRVFGELITLLEDDKRLGEENELKITLPNGEKNFGVPPNLYIVGTMNTADKSIALVDVALRRRFEFIGQYPEYDRLKSDEIMLLKKINENLFEKKKSADYLIGHAYFMKNQSIESVLRNNVIPLLMEYFTNKTDMVTSIFDGSEWRIEYDSISHKWEIQPE